MNNPAKPKIGIITALEEEYIAIKTLLKNCIKKQIPGKGGGRQYVLGEISALNGGKHVVALVLADKGITSAAIRVTLLQEYFSTIEYIIMVGIAGGVPHPQKLKDHVRLGDVVVSGQAGVVQYDFGKETSKGFIPCSPPRPPSACLLDAAKLLCTAEFTKKRPWIKFIDKVLKKINKFNYPGEKTDILYDSDTQKVIIPHPPDPNRQAGEPQIFLGPIASANILLKDPLKRDELRDKFGVKAVEMEASGIADATWILEKNYLIVRGICDYCDDRKGDTWHGYAAVVAAAYTRALLESMQGDMPETVQIADSLSDKPLKEPTDDKIRAALKNYFKRGPGHWMNDPILEISREQSYCPLHISEQRLLPLEAACDHPYAIVTGEAGSGKTSLMIHLVRELLDQRPTPTHWLLPVNFAAINSFNNSDNHPFTVLKLLLRDEYETFQYCWEKGCLWLYLDEIDPSLEEKTRLLSSWIERLRYENDLAGRANRIWFNFRGKDFEDYDGELKKWQKLPLCSLTTPEVWQYLRTQRGWLKDKWSSFYNYWISPSCPVPKQSLLGLNLTMKCCYDDTQQNQFIVEPLQALTRAFLKKILPTNLRKNNDIGEIDRLMVNTLSRQWKNFSPQDWKEWKGNISRDDFNQVFRESLYIDLGCAVQQSVLRSDRFVLEVLYPFMLNYWLVEAFLKTWDIDPSVPKNEMSSKLVALLENPYYWDLAVLCLNKLSEKTGWDSAFSHCTSYFNSIHSSDQASVAIKFLWKIYGHREASRQKIVLDQLLLLMQSYPELDEEITYERQLALDELALRNQDVPAALSNLLSKRLIRRHQNLRELFHGNGEEMLRLDLNLNSPQRWDEWLSLIEQYPTEKAVAQAIKACFRYNNFLDTRTINRILSAFSAFREEPHMHADFQTWVKGILANPQNFYNIHPQRTVVLLHALHGWEQFSSLEFIKKLYYLAKKSKDNDLKETAFDLMQGKVPAEAKNWLENIFDHENAPTVKEKILDQIIAARDIGKLEAIVKSREVPRLVARVAKALLVHYHRSGESEKESAVIKKILTDSILQELAGLPEFSSCFRAKVANAFINSRQRINIREAKIIIHLSADGGVVKNTLAKLTTEWEHKAFKTLTTEMGVVN